VVALDLALDVAGVGVAHAERVDLDGVVDDEVDGDEGVDLARVLASALHRRAHRGEVDDGGHACEVLHEDARGQEGQLGVIWRRLRPRGEGLDVFFVGRARLAEAEKAFDQDLQGHRQARRIGQPGL